MGKIKILNLYAGIGGNRKNWNNENFEITSVENNKELADIYKSWFPKDNIIIDDAKNYLIKNYKNFDFIWLSPPCQTHSKMRFMASKRGDYDPKLPNFELYELITFLKHFCNDKIWIVENVKPYYDPIIKPSFKIGRHLFWCNFKIKPKDFEKPKIKHNKITGKSERFGISLKEIKMKTRKDQILRNCVDPKIAEYILNSALEG